MKLARTRKTTKAEIHVVGRRIMTPEEVWKSRCAKKGWRCSKCASIPMLYDAPNFFKTGRCETCSSSCAQ